MKPIAVLGVLWALTASGAAIDARDLYVNPSQSHVPRRPTSGLIGRSLKVRFVFKDRVFDIRIDPPRSVEDCKVALPVLS